MQKANEHKFAMPGRVELWNSSHMVFEDPRTWLSLPEDTTIKENILVYFYWSGVMRRFVYVELDKWVCRWCDIDETNGPRVNEQRFQNLSGSDSCVGSKRENWKCLACDDTRSRDCVQETNFFRNLKSSEELSCPSQVSPVARIISETSHRMLLTLGRPILPTSRRCQSWKLHFTLINSQKLSKGSFLQEFSFPPTSRHRISTWLTDHQKKFGIFFSAIIILTQILIKIHGAAFLAAFALIKRNSIKNSWFLLQKRDGDLWGLAQTFISFIYSNYTVRSRFSILLLASLM